MKRAVIIIAGFGLAACAGTLDQNRERPPAATFVSHRPEAALEHCLAGALWFEGTPSIIPGEGSSEMAFTSDYGSELLLTLTPVTGATRIEVRLKHRNYLNHIGRAIDGCA